MFLSQKVNDFITTPESTISEMIKSVEAKPKNSETETDRIVDVFSEGLISKDKLREKMLKVNNRRESLETELMKLKGEQEQAILTNQVRKSVTEYCQDISQNLQRIGQEDFKAKQYLLTLLIDKIEIFKDRIQIHTVIPVDGVVSPVLLLR